MNLMTLKELNAVSGGGDANACASAMLGAASVGAIAGGAAGAAFGPYALITAGVGALVAGAYTAGSSPACSFNPKPLYRATQR